jgi:hypothetical protein
MYGATCKGVWGVGMGACIPAWPFIIGLVRGRYEVDEMVVLAKVGSSITEHLRCREISTRRKS